MIIDAGSTGHASLLARYKITLDGALQSNVDLLYVDDVKGIIHRYRRDEDGERVRTGLLTEEKHGEVRILD